MKLGSNTVQRSAEDINMWWARCVYEARVAMAELHDENAQVTNRSHEQIPPRSPRGSTWTWTTTTA